MKDASWIEGDRITRDYVEQAKLPRVEFTKIIEHIDHAVKVGGDRSRGAGFGLRWGQYALWDGGRHEAAEDHRGAAAERLFRG